MTSNDTITIPLTKGYSAVIDSADADLAAYKWQASVKGKNVYAKRDLVMSGKKRAIYLHREVASRIEQREILTSERVDHVDLNGLNNTRNNLRLATHAQNLMNRGKNSNNTTGYKGVMRKRDKFEFQITIHGKVIRKGGFLTAEDAHKAYIEAAKTYHGEFARFE